jgi:two-component system, chemotaxis family, chemotaxis protein CheY
MTTVPINYEMPVLVVDDVDAMQEVVAAVLRKAGFVNIETVSTGQAALERLRSARYGLIVADCEMEDMSGLDLLRQVRAEEVMKATRFIVISAHRRHEYVTKAAELGADCFIPKPFSPAHLLAKVKQVCAERPCFQPTLPQEVTT